jgi:hypothetical protein
VRRTNIFAALACALLAIGLLGCGATNNLQSITLNVTLVNGVAPTGQSGFVNLQGNGGTIQLQAMGNYSGSKSKDLTKSVTFTVVVDPEHNVDAFGNTLLPPCQAPSCPTPANPPYTQGTVEYSPTGLITAVEPATCTWIDTSSDPTKPSWFYVGDYVVTATYKGVTSQPVYIPVASSGGLQTTGNPKGVCDAPTS